MAFYSWLCLIWKNIGFAVFVAVALWATNGETVANEIKAIEYLPNDSAITVIDIRDEEKCLRGSFPASRCLPATDLLDASGRPVSFYALRWLLGTVGLSGDEKVAVYSNNEAKAKSVARLIYLSGQAHVITLPKVSENDISYPGEPRSLSRETVFSAPMRDEEIDISFGSKRLPLIVGNQ